MEDFEIRINKEGKLFAIKNIRQEIHGDKVTLIADIAGDEKAANQYLNDMANGLIKLLMT